MDDSGRGHYAIRGGVCLHHLGVWSMMDQCVWGGGGVTVQFKCVIMKNWRCTGDKVMGDKIEERQGKDGRKSGEG